MPQEDVLRALASLTPEQLSEYGQKSEEVGGTSDSFVTRSQGLSPHLLAALACEKYGMEDEALAFVSVIDEVDPVRGGDHKPSSHILGACVKGRVLQRQGRTAAAASAFEAAVQQAETVGLPLLAVFALRDLKLFVLDEMGHADHGSRRLGAVLRTLKDPAEMFSPLLDGLDGTALVSLAAPDVAYQVVYQTEDSGIDVLRKELQGLRLKELRKRAKDAGVDSELLEDATDADDPKVAVIQLLMTQSTAAEEGEASLRVELQKLRPKELRQRAKAIGVDADALEDAIDSASPKAAIIKLLVEHESDLPNTAGDRPHFGSSTPKTQEAKRAARKGLLPAGKHAMISYQWDDQSKVIAARESLTKLGVPCWMDVDGGMQQDIYESMAAGVENAACVVCFLSQKYQDSENCKLELKFAKQSGVPIVPVMVESTAGWRPSGWLGIVVAGALWTSLRGDESDFEGSIRGLVGQIKGAVPGSNGDAMLDDDDECHDQEDEQVSGAEASAELRAELERLRKATEAKPATTKIASFDPDAPAEIPAGVPELPPDFRPTAEIRTLLQNLLNSTPSTAKIGFWGMGGIGKTVTGAALVRDADVRSHFDQIIWLPLGQTPVMEKLQSSAMEQLTGKPMESNLSEEERHAALRDAFKGKRVLLALDDLWEEEHAPLLNFVDESRGSR
eukprot:COSAG06_NODE_8178_length_2247_cov_2.238827_1_plen_674_part_01